MITAAKAREATLVLLKYLKPNDFMDLVPELMVLKAMWAGQDPGVQITPGEAFKAVVARLSATRRRTNDLAIDALATYYGLTPGDLPRLVDRRMGERSHWAAKRAARRYRATYLGSGATLTGDLAAVAVFAGQDPRKLQHRLYVGHGVWQLTVFEPHEDILEVVGPLPVTAIVD
jgi:hypothetical protein